MRAVGKGPQVPRWLRNPRRAYDEDGREMTPATVAKTQQNGARGIIARCACNHEALLPFTGLHPDWYVPESPYACAARPAAASRLRRTRIGADEGRRAAGRTAP